MCIEIYFWTQSEDRESKSFSESLVLDDSEEGVIITGITDDSVAAKSGLQAGKRIASEYCNSRSICRKTIWEKKEYAGFDLLFLPVPGDEIVAATIHLDRLNKNEVLNILKVLEPYDNNMKVLTKKELKASAGLGSLGFGPKNPAEVNITGVVLAK